MDEKELEKIVVQIHIHWNSALTNVANKRKEVLEVWSSALHDLPHDAITRAVRELSLTETFIPRPAQVRKKAIQISGKLVPPPEPAAAWVEVQKLARSVTSGAVDLKSIDPCVLAAIHKMGGIADIAHNTNGDRTQFFDVYKTVVTEWESQAYAFVD